MISISERENIIIKKTKKLNVDPRKRTEGTWEAGGGDELMKRGENEGTENNNLTHMSCTLWV